MEIQQILQFSFQTLSKPSLWLLNLTLPSFKWLANTMLGYFPLNSVVEKIKNLTNKFNGLNTILLYFLKSDSCYINYWARILLFHKIPTTAGILLNSRKTSPSCVISHCVKSRYGPAEEFFFTFPFLAHSLVLGASLYLHFSPPPFLPPSSLLTLRCKCLAPPVALTESRISKTRFSSLMHQRGTAASLPSHADKCAHTN